MQTKRKVLKNKRDIEELFMKNNFNDLAKKYKKEELVSMYDTLVGLDRIKSTDTKIDIAFEIWQYSKALRLSRKILEEY
ncbi:hypothetical protein UT300012_23670 [Paraclostridium bifermentans]